MARANPIQSNWSLHTRRLVEFMDAELSGVMARESGLHEAPLSNTNDTHLLLGVELRLRRGMTAGLNPLRPSDTSPKCDWDSDP